MRIPIILITGVIAAVAIVSIHASRIESADTVIAKSIPFVKDQARVPQFGCLLGVRDFICEGK